MSGLDSIALAVAHLEERQNTMNKDSNPAILSRNSSDASSSSSDLNASLRASVAAMPAHPSAAGVVRSRSPVPPPPRALHVPPARVISVDEASSSSSAAAALNVAAAATKPRSPSPSSPSSSSNSSSNGSTFAYILADPIKWLQKTQDRPQLQPPTELALKVEPTDVLCGRGGETNHHPGNVQYRLLVKAFQPLYVSAKRRDKPLIAQCIVYSVRQVGGRFLKRANDKEWKDVGNTKAREKTSQALREGAPELRGDAAPKMISKQQQQQQQQQQPPPMMMPSPPTSQMPHAAQHHHHHHQGQPMSFAEAQFLSALLARQAALTRSVVTGQQPTQPHPMSHPMAHLSQQQQEYHHHPQQQQQLHHQALPPQQQQQLPPMQLLQVPPPPPSTSSPATRSSSNEENIIASSRKRPAVVSEHSDSDSIGSSNGSSSSSSSGGPRLKRFKMRFQQETTSRSA